MPETDEAEAEGDKPDAYQQLLQSRIEQLGSVVDLDSLTHRYAAHVIPQYYRRSNSAYRKVHSREGSIHMAINADGVYHESGMTRQAELLATTFEPTTHRVLELGCGMGYNLRYLAQQYPDIDFCGVDISPTNLQYAQVVADEYPNVTVLKANFHTLPFEPEEFDRVFAIEAFCHATDVAQALGEVSRILAPGGLFVDFDGWRAPQFDEHSDEEAWACMLVERSGAIDEILPIDEWSSIAQHVGFDIIGNEDFSQQVLPNLRRFDAIAQRYFRTPKLLRSLLLRSKRARTALQNLVAAYLMVPLIEHQTAYYLQVTLQKPEPARTS